MASLTASLLLSLLVFTFSVSAGQRIITAEPGDDVILPCRADENKYVIFVKWSRTDLGSDQPVLLYRDSHFGPDFQSPSFRNQVSLQDVKNGDMSLVLKNVTTDDTGTYVCRVVQGGNNHWKILDTEPICIIKLIVEAGNKEDGGSCTGWIVGFIVCAVVLVVVFVMCRRQKFLFKTRCFQQANWWDK